MLPNKISLAGDAAQMRARGSYLRVKRLKYRVMTAFLQILPSFGKERRMKIIYCIQSAYRGCIAGESSL